MAWRLVVYSDRPINAAALDARRSEMIDPDQQPRINGENSGGDSYLSELSDILSNPKVGTAMPARQSETSVTCGRPKIGSAAELLCAATDELPHFNVADAHPTRRLHRVLRGQRRESKTQCDPARWMPEP